MARVRIGELAARAEMTTKTLRFYEQGGLLPAPSRTPSGYRDYDGVAALARLRFITAAQSAGLTLVEIRQTIVVRDEAGSPCEHVVDLLDRHAAQLDARIEDLMRTRAEVERLRQRAGHLDEADCAQSEVCHVIPTLADIQPWRGRREARRQAQTAHSRQM